MCPLSQPWPSVAPLGGPIFLSTLALYCSTSCSSSALSSTTWSLLVGTVFRNHVLGARCPGRHTVAGCVPVWPVMKSYLQPVLASSPRQRPIASFLWCVYWPVHSQCTHVVSPVLTQALKPVHWLEDGLCGWFFWSFASGERSLPLADPCVGQLG